MHTEQDVCGTHFKQNRHGTNMDTTSIEAYLGMHTFHVDVVIVFFYVTNTRVMSRGEHKPDRL